VTASLVPPAHFDPYFKELAEEGSKYLREYHEPAGEHALDLVNVLCERAPKSEPFLRRIFESLQETRKTLNAEYVLKQAGEFIRYQRIRRGLSKAVNALQSKAPDAVAGAESAMRDALSGSYEFFHPGVFASDADAVLRFLDRAFDSFPTGIKLLDSKGLGPARKRLHTFAARLGQGKSWWLLHLSKEALMAGLRVAYVSVELSEDDISQRMVQTFFAVGKRGGCLKLPRFSSDGEGRFIELGAEELVDYLALDQERIGETLRAKLKFFTQRPPFVWRQFPTNTLTIDQLVHYLDALEGSTRFIPDLLVIDHASNMYVDPRQYRISLGQLYGRLRGLAIERNIAVATATQLNRDAAKRLWATADSLAEADEIGRVADYVITYNQTQAEHELGLARLFVAKGRTDTDRFGFAIAQAYSIGQFCLDEVGIVPAYWDRVDPKLNGSDDEEDDPS